MQDMTEETGVGKETSDCRAGLTPFKEWGEVKDGEEEFQVTG